MAKGKKKRNRNKIEEGREKKKREYLREMVNKECSYKKETSSKGKCKNNILIKKASNN